MIEYYFGLDIIITCKVHVQNTIHKLTWFIKLFDLKFKFFAASKVTLSTGLFAHKSEHYQQATLHNDHLYYSLCIGKCSFCSIIKTKSTFAVLIITDSTSLDT